MSKNEQDDLRSFKYRNVTILQWMGILAVTGVVLSLVAYYIF